MSVSGTDGKSYYATDGIHVTTPSSDKNYYGNNNIDVYFNQTNYITFTNSYVILGGGGSSNNNGGNGLVNIARNVTINNLGAFLGGGGGGGTGFGGAGGGGGGNGIGSNGGSIIGGLNGYYGFNGGGGGDLVAMEVMDLMFMEEVEVDFI